MRINHSPAAVISSLLKKDLLARIKATIPIDAGLGRLAKKERESEDLPI